MSTKIKNEEAIEVTAEEQPAMPVAVIGSQLPASAGKSDNKVTAVQAKVEAVADLTHTAYQNASSLKLTAEESAALLKDFPDEAFKTGARGKSDLIYIEHAYLRDRLIQVFGLGAWSLITRRVWSEKFSIPANRDHDVIEGERIYVEAMLMVRSCFVGEAIGDGEYFPKNNNQNYGDAVESAKTNALRRCCKEFGVGLQAWKKDWCQGWLDRKMAPGKRIYPPSTTTKTPPPAAAPQLTRREKFFSEMKSAPAEQLQQFLIDLAWIMPNEESAQLEDRYLPKTTGEMKAFKASFEQWIKDGTTVQPYNCPIPDPKAKPVEVPREEVDNSESDEAWRQFPMPFGKNAGVPLEELEKNYLFGLWANYTVETEYNGKPKKKETIEKDKIFRAMLDLAGEHYEFKKKD